MSLDLNLALCVVNVCKRVCDPFCDLKFAFQIEFLFIFIFEYFVFKFLINLLLFILMIKYAKVIKDNTIYFRIHFKKNNSLFHRVAS